MSAMEDQDPLSAWLTKRQAAHYLQLSEATLERGMKAGTLRFIGGGKGVRVRFRPEGWTSGTPSAAGAGDE
jgi:excisionase family DNA binding protein